jgi:hypothetical protein
MGSRGVDRGRYGRNPYFNSSRANDEFFFFEGTRVEVGSVRGTDVRGSWRNLTWGTTLFSLRKGQFTQNCITMQYP